MTTNTNYIIYNAIETILSKHHIMTLEELKSNSQLNEYWWLSCMAYAKKAFRQTAGYERRENLNYALACDSNDNIQDATIQIYGKFDYIVRKYVDITNDEQHFSEAEALHRFNKCIGTIIPSMLGDLYRRVSQTVEYEETDTTTGKKVRKTGKGLRSTNSCLSLDYKSPTESDSETSFLDYLSDSGLSAECRLLSNEAILEYLHLLESNGFELLGFMSQAIGMKNKELSDLLDSYECIEVFPYICRKFASCFDCPDALRYCSAYTEEDFLYYGDMTTASLISHSRSKAKARVKGFRSRSSR